MIDLLELAKELSGLSGHDKILYVKTEPEIEDFTKPFSGKLLLYGRKKVVAVPLDRELSNVFHQLRETVFSADSTAVFWNLKSLMSFFLFHVRKNVNLECASLDLKLIEGFLGSKGSPPASLKEALGRLNPYLSNEEAKKIHSEIHKPLAMRVVPGMETYKGVIDLTSGKYVYPSYEIEGQTFGRLNCHKSFDNCITPMNMGDDRKSQLKLHGDDEFFVNFDFKHMEVSMLRWLTDDKALSKAMEDYDDLYRGIYETVFKHKCDTDEKRSMMKGLFLPIMFGMVPGDGSQLSAVRQSIKSNFKTAWDYMEEHYERLKISPVSRDYFGRPRTFSDNPLSVRGFQVQSASAVFCQEKLIELHDSMGNLGKLVYSIHDGYVVVANLGNLNRVVVNGLKVLQGESKMCKGLRLKAACSIGVRLDVMKQIPGIKEKIVNS